MKINFNLPVFFKIAILFVLTQALGIYAAYKFLSASSAIQPLKIEGFSIYELVIWLAFTVVFIFLITRFSLLGSVFFKIFLTLVIFSGVQAVLGIWFSDVISTSITVLFLILFWSWSNIFTQDLTMILTFSGIGAIIGLSLEPITAAFLLVILSFYDIIAVYKTKHMVKLAESMIRAKAIFGFIVPSTFKHLKEPISNVRPGGEFMILGSGDVILPLLLSASLVRFSLLQAVITSIFSVAGLFLMHLIFNNQKVRRPMAALPPIAAVSIVGYLVSLLVR